MGVYVVCMILWGDCGGVMGYVWYDGDVDEVVCGV